MLSITQLTSPRVVQFACCPLVANASMTICRHSNRSCTMMLCPSLQHHFVYVVHPFPARSSSPVLTLHYSEHHILHQPVVRQKYQNNVSFLSMIFRAAFFLTYVFHYTYAYVRIVQLKHNTKKNVRRASRSNERFTVHNQPNKLMMQRTK